MSACRSGEKPCHVSSAPSHNAAAPTLSNIPYPILFAVSCYNISWTMDTNEGPPYSLHSTFTITSLHAAADAPPPHCSAAVGGVVAASGCSTKSTQTYFHIVVLSGDPAPRLVSLASIPIQSKILARKRGKQQKNG